VYPSWVPLPLAPWTCLAVAIVALTTGSMLHAGDKPPAVPEGYKPVKLPGGSTILVKEGGDPFRRLPSAQQKSDKYDPRQLFNHENSMAHKQFSASANSMAQKDADPHDQARYLTKSYTDLPSPDKNKSAFMTKYPIADPSENDQTASDFKKPYTTASIGRTLPKYTTSTSTFQGREAPVGDNKQKVYGYTDATKQYLGPGAQKVPEGVEIKENVVLSRMGDMPDRPLSVDEVKNLINHGIRPDFETVNDIEPSKPLNHPDYKPQPLRDLTPAEGQADRDAPVPPPGTMGNRPPENSEPLPQ